MLPGREPTVAARIALLAVVMALVTAALGVIVATASHQSGQSANAEPEEQSVTVGTQASITVTINPAANTHSVNIDFEHEAGPAANDPGGDADDPTPPDLSCVIGATLPDETPTPEESPSGTPPPTTASEDTRSCSVAYTGTTVGTDQWRIWIDRDGRDSNEEADDAENPGADDESETPPNAIDNGTGCGAVPSTTEPDCTDVVEVTWIQAEAETVDCDDQSGDDRETNPSGAGSSETYTCRIRDENNNPVNLTVRGEVRNGVNDPDEPDSATYDSPDYACGAVSGGECDITVTQNEGETGTARICFWVEAPGDTGAELCGQETNTDEPEANDLADQVEKTWTAATGTPTSSPTGTTTGTPTGSPSPTATGTRTGSPTGSPGPTQTSSPTRSATPTRTEEPTETRRFATNLTIDYSRGAFRGSVGSSKRRCQQFRLVTLKKQRPGKNKVKGQDSSNRAGNWRIFKRRARGRFYALVARKVFTARNGDRIVCQRDKSPTRRVRRGR